MSYRVSISELRIGSTSQTYVLQIQQSTKKKPLARASQDMTVYL
jgi:hypothetical protein